MKFCHTEPVWLKAPSCSQPGALQFTLLSGLIKEGFGFHFPLRANKSKAIKWCSLFKIRMAFLASKELDGVEEKHLFQAPSSPSSFPLPQAQSWLPGAIIRLWPLGLVLANAAVGVHGFQRKLVVWACLQLPTSSSRSYTVQTAQEQDGVTSIRALPQVSCDGMDGSLAHSSSESLPSHCRRQEARPRNPQLEQV